MRAISFEDHRRISAAIAAAESRTAGEICCVVARASGSYFFAAALMVTAGMLASSLVLAFALEYWWISMRLPVFVAAQMLAIAAALLILWAFPALRLRLVPRRLLDETAHGLALRQFLARNLHVTAERTGVLIFVSLAERYAEIVADSGIAAKVPQADWDAAIATLLDHARSERLADGIVIAVGMAGDLLARHFPARPGDANEIEDHLIEL